MAKIHVGYLDAVKTEETLFLVQFTVGEKVHGEHVLAFSSNFMLFWDVLVHWYALCNVKLWPTPCITTSICKDGVTSANPLPCSWNVYTSDRLWILSCWMFGYQCCRFADFSIGLIFSFWLLPPSFSMQVWVEIVSRLVIIWYSFHRQFPAMVAERVGSIPTGNAFTVEAAGSVWCLQSSYCNQIVPLDRFRKNWLSFQWPLICVYQRYWALFGRRRRSKAFETEVTVPPVTAFPL